MHIVSRLRAVKVIHTNTEMSLNFKVFGIRCMYFTHNYCSSIPMRKHTAGTLLAVGTAVLPFIASAQTLLNTLGLINTFLNAIMGLFITIAILVFFWGLITYLMKMGDESGRKEAIQLMIWGIIALFVMVSIWGILRLLQSTFKVTSNAPIVPQGIQINTNTVY